MIRNGSKTSEMINGRRKMGRIELLSLYILICIAIVMVISLSDNLQVNLLRVIVIALFSYCIYKAHQEEFIINIYLLFSITPLSLLIYSEKISPYYLKELTNSTWVLATLNMAAFIFAYNITKQKTLIRTRRIGNIKTELEGDRQEVSKKKLRFHAYLLCAIGQVPMLGNLLFHISFPFKSIIGFFTYIGLAFAFKSKKPATVIIAIIFAAMNFLEDFNKTRLLYLAISMLVCLEAYIVKTRKDKIWFFGGIAVAVAFMILVAFPLKSFARSGGNFFTFFNNAAEITSSVFSHYDNRIDFNGPEFMQMPYMYLVTAWNNLQYVMQTQDSRTYGLWMLKPLLGYLQIDGYFEKYYELISYSTFNTFTYISILFKDFGYFGSIFGSVFLGFYVKRIALKVKKDGSAFDVASYGLVAMATLEMFFSNHFFSLSYPFTIVIIGYIYKKLFKLNGY